MHIYVCTSTCVFFFNDAATTEIYTLSLHDALPIYRLVERHVTGGGEAADPRERLRFPVQQLERHALEVVGQIARRGTLVRMSGELELPPLHHVAGIGEARQHRASAVPVRVAARVIEVEMGVDDPAHVPGPVSQLAQRVLEPGAAVLPRTLVRHAVDVLELGAFLVPEAGVDRSEEHTSELQSHSDLVCR